MQHQNVPWFEGVCGVLLDAGNTLIRVRTSVGDVYAQVAARHGIAAESEVLDSRFREVFSRRKGSFLRAVSQPHSASKERRWWEALVREVFEKQLRDDRVGSRFSGFFEELYREFEKPDRWEVFPDVRPCLHALGCKRVPVGVVSNWDGRLHGILQGLDLARHFRFVLTSAEFGAEKPDPTIFLEGVRRLSCPAEDVVHVGDLVTDDVEGARGAGLRGVLLRRAEERGGGGSYVRDLCQLAREIASCRGAAD